MLEQRSSGGKVPGVSEEWLGGEHGRKGLHRGGRSSR